MIEIAPEVVELRSLMTIHRLKISAVFARAKLRPATWTRWAAGAQPNVKNIRAVRTAIDALAAERAEG